MPILNLQRRLAEIGRIRLGEKGERGEPRKLSTFRFTCGSKAVLEDIAKLYGGTVREWKGAPAEGHFQLVTTATQIPVVIPPMPNVASQYYETWSAGGCTRRCDGETELISGEPCKCDPDARECKPTTRVSMLLRDMPGIGVWRLESHGWNAATTFGPTVEMIASMGRFVPATLRLEQRTEKKIVDGKALTRKFVVPVLDVSARVDELIQVGGRASLPAPRGEKVDRPELPPPVDLPAENTPWKGKPTLPFGADT